MVNSHVSLILHEESFITKPLSIFLKHPSRSLSLSLSLTHTQTHTRNIQLLHTLKPFNFQSQLLFFTYVYICCVLRDSSKPIILQAYLALN